MHLTDSDWAHVDERARDFTGREWVFERVRTFLASDARMLVIVAPPGTGKTAIAARLAQASAGRLADEPALPVPAGTIDAAVFCRAGRVSPARGRPGSRATSSSRRWPELRRRAALEPGRAVNIHDQRRPRPDAVTSRPGERRRGQRRPRSPRARARLRRRSRPAPHGG